MNPAGNVLPAVKAADGCTAMSKGFIMATRRPHDLNNLPGIVNNIGGNTICAFGDAVSMSVGSYVSKFRSEFEAKIKDSVCQI